MTTRGSGIRGHAAGARGPVLDGGPASAARRGAAIGPAATLAVVLIGVTGDLSLSVPLWGYLVAGVVLSAIGSRARSSDEDGGFVLFAGGGLAALTVFVIDAGNAVPLAVWWPLWALHGSNVAYSLAGRRSGLPLVVAGGVSLAAAVVGTGGGGPELVRHVGFYAVLSGAAWALSGTHAESIAAERRSAEAVSARTELLSTLAQMNRLDADAVADEAVRGVAAIGYSVAMFGLVDTQRGLVLPIASTGFGADPRAWEPIPTDVGVGGAALARGGTIVIEDYQRWARAVPDRSEVQAAVGVPVFVDDAPTAVLLGARSTPGRPDDDQLELIEVIAAQAARALVNSRQFADERRTATHLAELDQLKEDFVSSVTHELRTPLTIIRGAIETVVGRPDLPPETRRGLLQRVETHAVRLDRLIAVLLELSQLETTLASASGLVALEGVLADAVRDAEVDGRRVVVEESPLTAVGDADLIRHAVAHLVENALTHTPPGTAVTVTAERVRDRVRVSVRDEGPGITEDELPHIRQRFYRGGPSTRRTSSGLGLGLAIVDRILEMHGTELEITSAPGHGAAFAFTLEFAGDREGAVSR